MIRRLLVWIGAQIAALYYLIIRAADLGGADGRISFQKWVLLAVLYASAKTNAPVLALIAVLAASFGRTMFSLFLRRGSFNATAADTRQHITQEIDIDYVQRWKDGDPDAGVL